MEKNTQQNSQLLFPKKYKIKLIPFLLEGVAADSKLNLADGVHPNEKGHQVLADSVYKALKDIL
jgi:acyl-CoA thioesterase I